MTPKNTPEETVVLTAEERAEKIRNTPRQSAKRLVEYAAIINEAQPERFDELFGDQADVLRENISKIANPLDAVIEKAVANQVALVEKALANEDPLNGYAHFAFDQEAFDEKIKPRAKRVVKSKTEKVKDIAAGASPEELRQLAAMLAEMGVTPDAAE